MDDYITKPVKMDTIKNICLAVENDFNDNEAVAEDEDLDFVRNLPEFIEMIKKMKNE